MVKSWACPFIGVTGLFNLIPETEPIKQSREKMEMTYVDLKWIFV
jgi:hypothetical protein